MDNSSTDPKAGCFYLSFSALPQYGFGSDLTFSSQVEHNPFPFRVYTPPSRPLSQFFDSAEPFFIARKFNNRDIHTVQDSRAMGLPSASSNQSAIPHSYADVVNCMDRTKSSSSSFITTSFSFAWAIWEATRRYGKDPTQAIEIAVIDAKAVEERAVTALELLRKGSPKE
jgi:hypothetical protein